MTNLAEILEKDWQRDVRQVAAFLGWRRVYHTFDSRRSDTGFPDLVLVRDRVVFLELKREQGRVTDTQVEWLRALRDAGAEVYVARPRHLEQLAAVLGPNGTASYGEARGWLLLELDTCIGPREAAA